MKTSPKGKLIFNLALLLLLFLGQSRFLETAAAIEAREAVSIPDQSSAGLGSTPPPDETTPGSVPPLQAGADNRLYLPLVFKRYPVPPPIFGIQTETYLDSYYLDKTGATNTHWLRNGPFSWKDIEPVRTEPPTYHWEVVNESGLEYANTLGLTIIAMVRYTPGWAQVYPGVSCGPIAQSAFDEFAQFLGALVTRYSAPPYNIKYWEIGNEVDVDRSLVPPDSPFGCWGNKNDPYYGGEYYGEMLKYAYPAIKAADPEATVMNGGMIVDCNPAQDASCLSSKFLEGILRNQGAYHLDIINFHAYAYYDAANDVIIDEQFYKWADRGGVVLGKADYLRQVMAAYGVSKPLMNTESSLLCTSPDMCVGTNFLEKQADYVVWAFVRSMAAGFWGVTWFTIEGPGWRNSGLLNGYTEKPAYRAYNFMAEELDKAEFSRKLSQYPELRAYELATPEKRIWVLWSPDHVNRALTLPADALQVYDKYGTTITPVANQVTVNSPIYIELPP